jgi:oligosaccharide repeat unit polymerase
MVTFAFIFVASLSSLTFRLSVGPRPVYRENFPEFPGGKKILNLLVWLAIFGCLGYIVIFVEKIGSYASLAHYYYYSRVAELDGAPLVDVGWFMAQMPPLAFVISLFALIDRLSGRDRKQNGFVLCLLLVLTAVALSITGTRSVLIIFVLMLFFSLIGLHRLSFGRNVVVVIVLLSLYMVSVFFMRASDSEKETSTIVDIFLKHTLLYVFGGVKGFDAFLTNGLSVYHQQFAALFGSPAAVSMDFVEIGPGLEGNVYSAFAVYVYYMGYAGALMLVSLIFSVVGFIYEYRYKNALVFLSWCFTVTATALTVFHDYFFSLFPYIGRVFLIYLVLSNAHTLKLAVKKILVERRQIG